MIHAPLPIREILDECWESVFSNLDGLVRPLTRPRNQRDVENSMIYASRWRINKCENFHVLLKHKGKWYKSIPLALIYYEPYHYFWLVHYLGLTGIESLACTDLQNDTVLFCDEPRVKDNITRVKENITRTRRLTELYYTSNLVNRYNHLLDYMRRMWILANAPSMLIPYDGVFELNPTECLRMSTKESMGFIEQFKKQGWSSFPPDMKSDTMNTVYSLAHDASIDLGDIEGASQCDDEGVVYLGGDLREFYYSRYYVSRPYLVLTHLFPFLQVDDEDDIAGPPQDRFPDDDDEYNPSDDEDDDIDPEDEGRPDPDHDEFTRQAKQLAIALGVNNPNLDEWADQHPLLSQNQPSDP